MYEEEENLTPLFPDGSDVKSVQSHSSLPLGQFCTPSHLCSRVKQLLTLAKTFSSLQLKVLALQPVWRNKRKKIC